MTYLGYFKGFKKSVQQLPAQVLKEKPIASPKDEEREKDEGLHKIMLLLLYV